MKFRTVLAAAVVVAAAPALAHGEGAETVIPRFAQEIPTIPGKSLVAVEVEDAPGAA